MEKCEYMKQEDKKMPIPEGNRQALPSTRKELEQYHVGEDLDMIMNLDPRGYGVCRLLYKGSRKHTGEPMSMKAAKTLVRSVRPGAFVFILTGFVLRPHLVPEMDGMVSSLLLARQLAALGAKPVIIGPEDIRTAVKNCAPMVGLHLYEDLQQVQDLPLSMGYQAFTKEKSQALFQAEQLLTAWSPCLLIANEAPGANARGVYHNATGLDCTVLEAKSDVLFSLARKQEIPTLAIGDLGNEMGMGTIGEHIQRVIPYAGEGECACGCGGGILAESTADVIITATVSDWGCYALMAAVAFLKEDAALFHNGGMEKEVMRMAAASGLIDMTGSLLPGIDGI